MDTLDPARPDARLPKILHNEERKRTMKRTLLLMAIFVTIAIPATQASQIPFKGSLGVGINGGLMIPASGDVTRDSSFNDFFKTGADLGAHLSFVPMKYLTLEAGFDYAFMKMKDEVRLNPGVEPYFSAPYVYLVGKWNLGALIKSERNFVNPYLLAGGGVYFWKVTDDGAGGDAIVLGNGQEFKKTSLGLQFGAGSELYVAPNISLFAEGKYHLVFSEDTEKFGDDFSNLSGVSISGGLTFYFPLSPK
jgi:hypothetical protein